MAEFRPLIQIGFDRGEADFRITMAIADLPADRMKELRAMIPVAIGEAEAVCRREREKVIAAECSAARALPGAREQ